MGRGTKQLAQIRQLGAYQGESYTEQTSKVASYGATFVPNHFLDKFAPQLSNAELRLALYIIRRTYGFRKECDAISLTQFMHGITTGAGEQLDGGTGLSKTAVLQGLKGLVEKGIIHQEKSSQHGKATGVSIYQMCLDNNGSFSHQKDYSADEYSETEMPLTKAQAYKLPEKTGTVTNIEIAGKVEIPVAARLDIATLPTGLSKATRTGYKSASRLVQPLDPQIQSIQNKRMQNKVNNNVVGTLALHNKSFSDEQKRLCEELQSFGLNQSVTTKLVTAYAPEYIQRKLALFKRWLNRTGSQAHNSAGYLRRAIEEDYQDSQPQVSQPKTFAAAQAFLQTKVAPYETPSDQPVLHSRYRKHNSTLHKPASAVTLPHASTANIPVETEADSTVILPVPDWGKVWEGARQAAFDRFGLVHLQPLLVGSRLELAGQDAEDEYQLVLHTAEIWQSRSIRLTDLQTIRMAVRGCLGARCALVLAQS